MRVFFTFSVALLFYFPMQSQNIYSGCIQDQDGRPIDFANINKVNSTSHAHSDENGCFSLSDIVDGDTILISHMSFEAKTIVADQKSLMKKNNLILIAKKFDLDQVVIYAGSNTLKTISQIDLKTNPVSNAQEMLRKVPGLFIGQHAGGGKAEQIFLRGFDIDHGTDIDISVDGMPVNMVSHAHGQGYADLHFLIPEIIEDVTYGKGPYDSHKGNFATAGYVAFKTIDKPKSSFFTSEAGSFNTIRDAGLLQLMNNDKESAFLATEFLLSDGPFESTQAFNRFNLFIKYTKKFDNNDKLSISVSTFTSRWDASGQIPDRAVKSGMISRFGSIDNTEGGNTSRNNYVMNYTKNLGNNKFIKTNAYLSKYKFLLFSNFTFFLNDPINGDQIKQKEDRNVYGVNAEYNQTNYYNSIEATYKIGAGLRYDDVNDIELSSTKQRTTTIKQLALGQIDESNVYTYADATFNFGDFQINTGLRFDQLKYIYDNQLLTPYQLATDQKWILSPKLNLQYALSKKAQIFAKFGKGFHSNDTRVLSDKAALQILPSAYGMDVGTTLKPIKNLMFHFTVWYLYLDQEFVYVGDGGIVEPSGKTKRVGADISIRYQPLEWLFIYSDLNLANPKSIDSPEGENFIPLAPTLTNTGGISFNPGKKWTGGIRYRHLAERSANEDYSIVAKGYTIVDLNVNYNLGKIMLGVEMNNILNAKWNETQFATETRLQNESAPKEEIHFTPGAPISFKGKLTYSF